MCEIFVSETHLHKIIKRLLTPRYVTDRLSFSSFLEVFSGVKEQMYENNIKSKWEIH